MTPKKKTGKIAARILLVMVYAAFFAVQLTSYFDHSRGSIYRLSSDLFLHANANNKQVKDGFSNTDAASAKISIRLNKKFHPEPGLLYTSFTDQSPAGNCKKISGEHYAAPFIVIPFFLTQSLRGPPASA